MNKQPKQRKEPIKKENEMLLIKYPGRYKKLYIYIFDAYKIHKSMNGIKANR